MSNKKMEHNVLFLGFSLLDAERIKIMFEEKRRGLNIVFASSNERRLIIAKKGVTTAIFINQTSELINGYSFIKNIQSMDQHIPTVLMTAPGDKKLFLTPLKKVSMNALSWKKTI